MCKILYDPECTPPHQYIATYRYIEEIMKANAIVHVGTGGNLEYLPEKTNALSLNCWPDLVLGNLPNLYIFNAGVGVEGTGAKRRSSKNAAKIKKICKDEYDINRYIHD